MTNKEFIAYVNDKKRQGVSDNQIARSLGMSLAHFLGKMNAAEKVEQVENWKVEKKPVSGFGDPDAVKASFQRAEEKKHERPKKDKVNEVKVEVTPKEEPKEEPKTEDESWMD